MSEARLRKQWDQTSQVLALIANGLCRGKGRPPYTPAQFNPFHRKAGPDVKLNPKQSMQMLRRIYGDKDYGR